ncbi:hypothetical protein HPB47_008866 [Ixodes persulcatus]|uniref:Uncharacterized protein n=1 Tax=Ixodes persulcatus TaxID=34615 RepID=A0AC60P3H3_IXOPE|nr:hypothetical protein HPB47_008866 [Ixodes persulcatus]
MRRAPPHGNTGMPEEIHTAPHANFASNPTVDLRLGKGSPDSQKPPLSTDDAKNWPTSQTEAAEYGNQVVFTAAVTDDLHSSIDAVTVLTTHTETAVEGENAGLSGVFVNGLLCRPLLGRSGDACVPLNINRK